MIGRLGAGKDRDGVISVQFSSRKVISVQFSSRKCLVVLAHVIRLQWKYTITQYSVDQNNDSKRDTAIFSLVSP